MRLAIAQRAALVTASVEATNVIIPAYQEVIDSLLRDSASLQRLIEDSRVAGVEVNDEWLRNEMRFTLLIQRYESGIASLDSFLSQAVSGVQVSAASSAANDAAQILRAVGVSNVNPVFYAARSLTPSAGTWMANLAPSKGNVVRKILLDGVARGRSPVKTARLLAAAGETNVSHALTVVRTEQMKAYREVNRESYKQNSAVQGWQWFSRRSVRTCSFCLEQDGQRFPLSETLDSHPRCMCTMLPVVDNVDYGNV